MPQCRGPKSCLKGRTAPSAATRLKDEMNAKRRERREDSIAKARRQQLAHEDFERAATLDKSAVSIAVNVRRAASLGPGQNLQQLEYIRLTLGFKTELPSKAYDALVTSALKAGLIELLGTNLSLSLTPKSAIGALKASYIACNLAADSEEAAAALLPLSPVLIAHVGLSYGSALCTQCAWTLSNLATLSTIAAHTLVSQGAIPTLLEVLEGAGRNPEDPSLAYAGATCAWALCNIIRGSGDSKAANTLLSVTEPPVDTVLSRVLTHGMIDPDLCAESAWLLVHTLENVAPSATALACRGGIVQALCWCLETAVGECGPEEQARLLAMRDRWLREGIHAWERSIGHQGPTTTHFNSKAHESMLMGNSYSPADEAMRDCATKSSDDEEASDVEDSKMEGSRAGQQGIDQFRLWVADPTDPSGAPNSAQAQGLPNATTDASSMCPGNPSMYRNVSGQEGTAVQGCCSHGGLDGGMGAPLAGAMKGVMDAPSTTQSDRESGQQQQQQQPQQLCSGQLKWGLQLDTSLAGTTSDMHEQSLLATSQLSARTFSTSDCRGLEGQEGRAAGGVMGAAIGSDAAGRGVVGGQSCMASEGEQETQVEAPIRSLMIDPLIRCLGALLPHMSSKQLLAVLPAHACAAARALLVVATSEACPSRCAACWALANMASSPAGAAMLQTIHAGRVLIQLLRETKNKLLRCEAATVLFNLCVSLANCGTPSTAANPNSADSTAQAAASVNQNEQERDANDLRAGRGNEGLCMGSDGGNAVQEHLASAALHCTLVEMLQDESGEKVSRSAYDSVALQMLALMARCFPDALKAFSTLGGKAAFAAFQRNRTRLQLEPVAALVAELAPLLYC